MYDNKNRQEKRKSFFSILATKWNDVKNKKDLKSLEDVSDYYDEENDEEDYHDVEEEEGTGKKKGKSMRQLDEIAKIENFRKILASGLYKNNKNNNNNSNNNNNNNNNNNKIYC